MDETRKRTVELPADLDKAIEDAVAAGEYADAQAAIGGALAEWKERRENFGYTIAELRAEIQKGIDSGVVEDSEKALDELSERYGAFGKNAAAE